MSATKTIDPTAIPQSDLHACLLSAVAPRPICFASTIDAEGNVNLSPFSFFNVFSSNPPVMIFSPARSGRDNSLKHSHQNVKEIPEVVINIVDFPLVEQMSLSSTAYEKGVNEFVKSGLTEVASEKVRPPRVAEAPISFECTVTEIIELADTPGAGNLILAKVELIHINSGFLDNSGKLDPKKLDLVGRMGGSWYTRASGDSLFEIPKPIKNKGIGVDQLPKGIRNSSVLTGNNLGRLGNMEQLPINGQIEEIAKDDEIKMLTKKLKDNPSKLKKELHWVAQQILNENNTEKALAILMYAEKLG
ncbi:flavin reductase family protein [Flagellimonas pacifica]|uniref:NADH-FMN oxidoreductase RutF, flavin reductase (DIM6/NTAB) family n=1 Tax=Flagellimonas pacifica TaxID=1247520 RepID=A0A285MX22_9FLAO|nr:flavin reductase family protein [Allomuricauda parva]SNZ01087.1 NADH-FMN oxidoreductase RutF, flavin reductase (DIM6/NTAB) family [Allomuricauda parva]